MARRRKYAQYDATGCKICGDKTVGRGIAKHLQAHSLTYDAYKACFKSGKVILDELKEAGKTAQGKKVMVHVLVRRFTV